MKQPFSIGDKKYYQKIVQPTDTAAFDSGAVHPVYATFALGRDAEWVCRLFVLDMKEVDEEGIGTYLEIKHEGPALVGEKVDFTAELLSIEGNSIICTFEAYVGNRKIAKGKTGQKVLKKQKIENIFAHLKQENSK
jgi:predicted thioesterase